MRSDVANVAFLTSLARPAPVALGPGAAALANNSSLAASAFEARNASRSWQAGDAVEAGGSAFAKSTVVARRSTLARPTELSRGADFADEALTALRTWRTGNAAPTDETGVALDAFLAWRAWTALRSGHSDGTRSSSWSHWTSESRIAGQSIVARATFRSLGAFDAGKSDRSQRTTARLVANHIAGLADLSRLSALSFVAAVTFVAARAPVTFEAVGAVSSRRSRYASCTLGSPRSPGAFRSIHADIADWSGSSGRALIADAASLAPGAAESGEALISGFACGARSASCARTARRARRAARPNGAFAARGADLSGLARIADRAAGAVRTGHAVETLTTGRANAASAAFRPSRARDARRSRSTWFAIVTRRSVAAWHAANAHRSS